LSTLLEKYPQEVQVILAKYPPEYKRSAVMPLLYLAQLEAVRESGRLYVSQAAMDEIASMLDISATEVASIVGFYSLYYDAPAGRYHIQVCTDLPCALRGADQFLKELCKRLNIQPGETTTDGLITVEPVMCLAACDRAPMFQLQSDEGITYYENQSVDSAMALIDALRHEAAGKRR
jgi:NADH-quinone oxidoreductase E subunit